MRRWSLSAISFIQYRLHRHSILVNNQAFHHAGLSLHQKRYLHSSAPKETLYHYAFSPTIGYFCSFSFKLHSCLMNQPWSISDSFQYWVRPNLDVLYCLTNYYGSSFHAFGTLILELLSCRSNIERTNNILFNAAWPYMACSQFIYRQSSFLFRHIWQSSFLFRSGSAIDSALSRCTDALWLLFVFICLPYGI